MTALRALAVLFLALACARDAAPAARFAGVFSQPHAAGYNTLVLHPDGSAAFLLTAHPGDAAPASGVAAGRYAVRGDTATVRLEVPLVGQATFRFRLRGDSLVVLGEPGAFDPVYVRQREGAGVTAAPP